MPAQQFIQNLLRNCTGMIGNSSSGLVESSIFKIPSLSLEIGRKVNILIKT